MEKSLEQMLAESAKAAAEAVRTPTHVPTPKFEVGRVYFETRDEADRPNKTRTNG